MKKDLITEIATRARRYDHWSFGHYLPNPDPVLKKMGKDISAYRELLSDGQVRAGIRRRKAVIKGLEWRIPPSDYDPLIAGQAKGQHIIANEQGYPMLVDPKPSPYHQLINSQWVISTDSQAQLKAEQQAKMWEKIKQKRYENGLGGVYIERVGKWFQTGEEEKTKYLGLDKVIDKLGEIDWKCADNTFTKMNRTLLDEIFLQMVVTENADHINAEKHRIVMMTVENPLEYDYSSGWTRIYGENN